MDTSKLAERAGIVAQSTKDRLSVVIQDIVEDAGEVAGRVVHGRHHLTDSDVVVAVGLAKMSEQIAQAFVDLPPTKRSTISDAADRGDLLPLDQFIKASAKEAGTDPALWKGADLLADEAPVPPESDGRALLKTAARGLRFGTTIINVISIARFAGSLIDPNRSLLSKGLRIGTVAAQMGWSKRTDSGESESTAADAFVFADALLGPYALRRSPTERLRRYWRENTVAVLSSHMRPTPLRQFLLDVATLARLDVADARLGDASTFEDHLRRGTPVSETYAARVVPALYRELSFDSVVVVGDGEIALARVVKIGLQKGVLEASESGDTLWVRGGGVVRAIDVPNGEVLVAPNTYASLHRLLAKAAEQQGDRLAQISIVLSLSSLSAYPGAEGP